MVIKILYREQYTTLIEQEMIKNLIDAINKTIVLQQSNNKYCYIMFNYNSVRL